MTPRFKHLATSSNILFIAAVLMGLFLPQAEFITFFLILPAMTLILTVTLLRYPKGFFREPKKLVPAAILGNLLNYIILGNIIILGSIFLIRDEKIWIGMVLIAAMPPAVCLLKLSEIINADKLLAFGGFAGTYAAAIILTPLIGVAFLKFIPISYAKLIVLVLSLVALPLIFSRMAFEKNWKNRIEKQAETIIGGCNLIIFYTLAARNADVVKQRPIEILLISAIALMALILVVTGFLFIRKFNKFNPRHLSALLLLGSMKDYGMAGVVALYVFGGDTALPALIFSAFLFPYYAGLQFKAGQAADSSPRSMESEPSADHR